MMISSRTTDTAARPEAPGFGRIRLLLAAMAAALLLLAGAATADAANRTVLSGGNDTGDCTGTACLTVQYAIDQAANGDNISIGSGTFTGAFTVNKSLRFRGDGSATILTAASGNVITLAAGAAGSTIENLKIQGATNGIYTNVAGMDNITLEDVEIANAASYAITIHSPGEADGWTLTRVNSHHSNIGLRIRGAATNLTVTDSHFDDNQFGLYVNTGPGDTAPTDTLSFTDTSFNRNQQMGVWMQKGSNVLFERVEVIDSGTSGGYPGGIIFVGTDRPFENISIIDSVITGADGPGISIQANSPSTLQNVNIDGTTVSGNGVGIGLYNGVTDITVSNSDIDDNTTGIRINTGSTDPDDPAIADNTFTGNETAVHNLQSTPVDLGAGNTFSGNQNNTTGSVNGATVDRYVDATGSDSGNICSNVGTPCATIQRAVNQAGSGETIHVAVGTYTEQVINNGKDLTIEGADKATTIIKAPATQMVVTHGSNIRGIVAVNNGGSLNVSALTLDGDAKGNINNVFVGFDAFDADLSLDNVKVTAIRDPYVSNPPPVYSGTQHGLGVYIQSTLTPAGTATLSVTNSQIEDFQKSGIIADRAGVSFTIDGNTILCGGDQSVIAQNAIQVSRGASGTVTNNTVGNCAYTGPLNASSAGILAFDVGGSTVISDNTIQNSDLGVSVSTDPANSTVTIEDNAFNDNGIAVSTTNPVPENLTAPDNTFTGNDVDSDQRVPGIVDGPQDLWVETTGDDDGGSNLEIPVSA